MKSRRDKLDALYSQLIREANNYTCQACGKYHVEGERQGLHASHFFSRRKQSVRFDKFPGNVFAHCFSCHQRLGENPHEFHKWAWAELGPVEYERLLLRAQTIMKRNKKDKAELYEEMKAKHAWMLEERRKGNLGRLEFEL
jgi:hypothetical protein